jgi:flavin reductase (DIM6/NTAB) family NADH-FMN oxidoreductase RutF
MPSVSLRPDELTSSQLYDLLVEAVQPRPIALVSTVSKEGVPNLAPFSFFMLGGNNPPSLAYSPTVGPEGREKNSVTNVEETGEFVVNAVTRAMEEGMNASAFGYPPGFDEWTVAAFTPVDSELVRPKRVAESPVQLECKLFQIVKHGTAWGAARYVIGEIVRIHVAETLLEPGARRLKPLRLIGRLGGREYIDLDSREIFELARPTSASAPS